MTISRASDSADLVLPADAAWNEAFERVESYLRAYGLESRVLLSQVTAEIIQEAQVCAVGHCGDEEVALALQVTHARIGAWFARAGHAMDWTNERTRAQGRLELVVADLPGRWADYFLSPEIAPADLTAAVTSFQMLPGPELRLSNMAPAPLEFGFREANDPRQPATHIWLPARVVASWLLIFGFFGIAWAASH